MVRVCNYKYCVVPGCGNTTSNSPQKLFIVCPRRDLRRRHAWLKNVRRAPSEFSDKSNVYVCEDHFNLEEDMENFYRYRVMKGKIIMKKDAVPHVEVEDSDMEAAISLCLLAEHEVPPPTVTMEDKAIQCKPQKSTKSVQCDLHSEINMN